jgi:hypothetical protein
MYKNLLLLIALSLVATVFGQNFFYVSPPQNYSQFGYGASPDASFTMYYKVYNGVPQALGFNYTIEDLEIGLVNRSAPMTLVPVLLFPIPSNYTTNPPIPYNLLAAYFDPIGHPPATMEVPHFDLHYFYLTVAERAQLFQPGPCGIGFSQQQFCQAIMPLPEGCCPTDYTPMGVVFPGMGSHTMNMSEPDMNGHLFVQDMVYGTWNGSIAFNEAMVNVVTMLNVSNGNLPNPYCTSFQAAMPKYVNKAGWYASQVCTGYNATTGIGYSELNSFIFFDSSTVRCNSGPRTACTWPFAYTQGCECNFNDSISLKASIVTLLIAMLVALFSL